MNRMNAKKLIAAVLAAGLGVLAACQSSPTEKTDQNGPYINMTQYEFTTTVGTPINFTNISGYDDYDGLLNTHLEGYVDYNTAGDYYPSITCTDFSGNKTSVPITIHVLPALEEGESQASAEPAASAESGCPGASDPSLACDVVPDETASRYSQLFYGSQGSEACQALLEEDDGRSCQPVYRNDGKLWGYGLLEAQDDTDTK